MRASTEPALRLPCPSPGTVLGTVSELRDHLHKQRREGVNDHEQVAARLRGLSVGGLCRGVSRVCGHLNTSPFTDKPLAGKLHLNALQ